MPDRNYTIAQLLARQVCNACGELLPGETCADGTAVTEPHECEADTGEYGAYFDLDQCAMVMR